MLWLSYLWKSKDIWSVRCVYRGCDAIHESYFGGPYKELSVKVPGMYWSLDLTPDIPKNVIYLKKGKYGNMKNVPQ